MFLNTVEPLNNERFGTANFISLLRGFLHREYEYTEEYAMVQRNSLGEVFHCWGSSLSEVPLYSMHLYLFVCGILTSWLWFLV